METKRIYPSTQMVLYLAPNVLKVLMWVLGWQGKTIVYYPSQYQKALKMDSDEIERCIQSLIDKNILTYRRIDAKWILEPVGETFQKFYDVKVSKVIESDKTLTMADEATWNIVEDSEKKEASWEDLTESQLEKLINRLQIIKNEKEQTKKVVVASKANNDDIDDLPF